MPWRTITGEELADTRLPQLQVVIAGVFEKRRFLDLIRHFIVFEDVGGGVLAKKMAGYHQYHAVNVALQETIRACVPPTSPWQAREVGCGKTGLMALLPFETTQGRVLVIAPSLEIRRGISNASPPTSPIPDVTALIIMAAAQTAPAIPSSAPAVHRSRT